MSGSWVGSPSWITEARGVAARDSEEVRFVFSASVTSQSCHLCEAQEIYRRVQGRGAPHDGHATRGVAPDPESRWTTCHRASVNRGRPRVERSEVEAQTLSPTADGADVQLGERLGLKPGMVVQELGWDEDVDDS